jgi:protein-tyrosine phosphatase
MADTDRPRVVVVCSGNICRSPMAAKVLAHRLAEAGLAGAATVESRGVGPWHVDEPMDQRAAKVLASHGIDTAHTARQLDSDDLDADLLLAMDTRHYRELRRQVENSGGDPAGVRMYRSFDAASVDAALDELDVADPYYGGRRGFDELYDTIGAATDGLLEWVRARS